ncbi:MAG: DUF881 domain-containing protein [Bacillota bacterium]
MKSTNIRGQFAVSIVCVILGLVLALQFKSVQKDTGGVIPTLKAQELASELKKTKEEKQQLVEELNTLEAKIKEIEDAESKEDVLVKNLSAELEKYKIISGFRSVKGPGVIVVVDDPPLDPEFPYLNSSIMDRPDFLLQIVNELVAAGAEAISINDQRIVSRTEISLAGDNINVNSVPTANPFTIKAIGNPETLEAALNIRYGFVDNIRTQFDIQVSIAKKEEIVIPRYNEIIKFRYAKPIEEKTQ